jgi:hypothetical protein
MGMGVDKMTKTAMNFVISRLGPIWTASPLSPSTTKPKVVLAAMHDQGQQGESWSSRMPSKMDRIGSGIKVVLICILLPQLLIGSRADKPTPPASLDAAISHDRGLH